MKKIKAHTQKQSIDTPLNKLRIKNNLTVREIADQMGVSIGTVSILFNKTKIPTRANLMKLSKVFNMDYYDLCKYLGITPDMEVKTSTAASRKYTFWNTIRNESGLTIVEVAEGIGKPKSRVVVGKYFTGEVMPNDETITALCNLFDVEFERGKEEFSKAYDAWHNRLPSTPETPIAEEVPVPEIQEEEPEDTLTAPIGNLQIQPTPEVADVPEQDIGKLVYGKVDYDEFNMIKDCIDRGDNTEIILETIYGKVNCKAYNTVYDLIKRK